MSAISEFIREGATYKKVVLAVAVTAGTGLVVYGGYRQWAASQKKSGSTDVNTENEEKAKKPPPPPSPAPSTGHEGGQHPPAKPETPKPPSSPAGGGGVPTTTGSPRKSDDLSTSGTFVKVPSGPADSDNFEHLTMSQVVQPAPPSPPKTVEKKTTSGGGGGGGLPLFDAASGGSGGGGAGPASGQPSSDSSFTQLSMSQASKSVVEPEKKKEEGGDGSRGVIATDTKHRQPPAAGHESKAKEEVKLPTLFGQSGHSGQSSEGVKAKDENDIVVVEKDSEKSGGGSGDAQKRIGMASFASDFDSSRVSPVFGGQRYERVDVEPDELVTFDPAKCHPAVVGFKFGSDD